MLFLLMYQIECLTLSFAIQSRHGVAFRYLMRNYQLFTGVTNTVLNITLSVHNCGVLAAKHVQVHVCGCLNHQHYQQVSVNCNNNHWFAWLCQGQSSRDYQCIYISLCLLHLNTSLIQRVTENLYQTIPAVAGVVVVCMFWSKRIPLDVEFCALRSCSAALVEIML